MVDISTSKETNQVCQKSFPDVAFFFNLHSRKQELLDILFELDCRYKGVVFISQRKLAALLGISREWTNKLIAYLVEHKILSIEHNRNHSNYYILSEHFKSFDLCKSLSKIFKNLYIPAVFLSFSEAAPTAVSEKDFTHTNVNYLYNKRIRNTYNQSTKKIGEAVMKNEFSVALREIKSISLTDAGMAILSAFPDEALRNTDVETRNIKNLRNPFGFFYARCKKYCIDNNLIPNWELQRTLLYQYEIRADSPMIFEKKESTPLQVSANKPKQESKKSVEWSDPDRRFKSDCPLNHKQELENLLSEKGVLGLQNLCKLMGEESAKKYYTKIIKNHEECLKNNHIQPIIIDEPPLMDYGDYDEADNMVIEF